MNPALNICVYCGSSETVDDDFKIPARELGRLIANGGHRLIWGGGSVGLMGELARSVHRHHGQVVGVIPQFMADTEVAYRQADELVVTQTMRQRKAVMEERSDAFVVLPGGLGTLEEMFEILTGRLLEQHHKQLVIINHRGFYDRLLAFFEHLYQTRFAREKSRRHYHVADSAAGAMEYLTG